MRNNRAHARVLRHLDGIKRFTDGADLIQLDQDCVAGAQGNTLSKPLRVRNKQVVADELHLIAQLLRHLLPAFPVFFVKTVLDRIDRIFLDKALPVRNQLIRSEVSAGLGLMIEALAFLALPFRGCCIHRKDKIPAGFIARVPDRLQDMLDCIFIACKIRRKAAFVSDCRCFAFRFQKLLQRVENFGRPAKAFPKCRCAGRHNHEFLCVNGIRRVRAAVQNIHHRDRKRIRVHAAEEPVQRQIQRLRGRVCRRDRNCENGIGAEDRLVLRAVQLAHDSVDFVDVRSIHACKCGRDLLIDICDSLGDTLASEFCFVAVPQLEGFEFTG